MQKITEHNIWKYTEPFNSNVNYLYKPFHCMCVISLTVSFISFQLVASTRLSGASAVSQWRSWETSTSCWGHTKRLVWGRRWSWETFQLTRLLPQQWTTSEHRAGGWVLVVEIGGVIMRFIGSWAWVVHCCDREWMNGSLFTYPIWITPVYPSYKREVLTEVVQMYWTNLIMVALVWLEHLGANQLARFDPLI